MNISEFLREGLLSPSLTTLAVWVFVSCQVTLFAVTGYLHRGVTHGLVTFAKPLEHILRAFLFFFTGMVTREWVAVHRTHHAFCDEARSDRGPGDPHSPVIYGLPKVFFFGVWLYREAAKDKEVMKRDAGSPNDWVERNLYTPYSFLGVVLSFVTEFVLFGATGIAVWVVQVVTVPLLAAGGINGIGHAWGYQNYRDGDVVNGKPLPKIGSARNIWPVAAFVMGEELHNNHHAFSGSYRFSKRWFEFDLGAVIIDFLSALRLASVRRG